MKDKVNKIHNCNNIDLLQELSDNSINSIITDVPYALGKINALKMLKEDVNNTKGFMGQSWDVLPTKEFLSECLRVLKNGSFFVTTFIPRQDLQTIFLARLIEAGFDVSFTPLYWTFKTGFPKANNIARKIDKRYKEDEFFQARDFVYNKYYSNVPKDRSTSNPMMYRPVRDEAKYCNGLYGGCPLKPAVEVILIAMKPHNAKSQIDQGLNWYQERMELLKQGVSKHDLYLYTKEGTGGTWLDNARISPEQELKPTMSKTFKTCKHVEGNKTTIGSGESLSPFTPHVAGRFPANLLVEDNALDTGVITKSINKDLSKFFSLDSWVKNQLPMLHVISKKILQLQQDAEQISPFLHCTKTSVSEKNAGLTEGENTHPTTKPISLFSYLITLFTVEDDLILDPFCGSGTTPIACVLTNRNFLGCDLDKGYCNIAKDRINYWTEQKTLLQKNKNNT